MSNCAPKNRTDDLDDEDDFNEEGEYEDWKKAMVQIDKKNKEPKSGYSKQFIWKKISGSKKRVKTLVPGSLGRLVNKLNQYNEIYDIWEMDIKEIISLLPKEFDELKV